MSLFARKYSFARSGVAQTVSRVLERGANAVASMDGSNKSMGERLEQMCAKAINEEPDVEVITRRLSSKYGINAEMHVIPIFNDQTLLIDEYVLAVPNSQGVLTPAIRKESCGELIDYMTKVVVSQDNEEINAFIDMVNKAATSK